MTIKEFSQKSGLPPSTLRYYEANGLLVPNARLDNGYRVYTESQIEEARLINSLRQAGVSISQIVEFLSATASKREKLLHEWRREVATKLLSIQVANQFLNGFEMEKNRVHLINWETSVYIAWFSVKVPRGIMPFRHAIKEKLQKLQDMKINILSGSYVRVDDVIGGELIGDVGFIVMEKNAQKLYPLDENIKVEHYPATLFVSMELAAEGRLSCKPIYHQIKKFGFEPNGKQLLRYMPDHNDSYLLMVPVVQIK